ncbi:DUF1684 domain-containing protein [Dokdonella koreensis]|uniref:DUF1684 domain-containing protein n=1 Tax=Dokdonella koreensis DS-123 TaxID=1300342 RepID=A0A160DWS5_9GAMM|nr:DUF1684 domain-containing protein [Dokdonella koreensis]ANB18681.1 Hypothetical protein I596_2685 [Dokdonella koreensis DS-123]
MTRSPFVAILAVIFAMTVPATAAPSDYTQQIQAWQAKRLERLQAPEGWLSLIGLDWLQAGRNTIGSADGNDIVLKAGPAKLGVAVLDGGGVTLELDPAAEATIDGQRVSKAALRDDAQAEPSVVRFGTASFIVIKRGDRYALRVRDSEAPTRTHFLGLDRYPIDPSWRIEAQWVAFDPPRTLDIPNIIGTVDAMTVPGKAVFEREGRSYELLPVIESPDATQLFFILADRTSGKETYGAARFLYADVAKDGVVVLDFNKAYNPPCAFTPYATCPLAPPENRLGVAVTAGEKKYRGSDH